MISFDEALSLVLARSVPLGTITVDLDQSLGYTTALPLIAPFALPLFDNSKVDGYGVRIADVAEASTEVPAQLQLDGVVRAGQHPEFVLMPGSAVKMFTGAEIPSGVEAVIMQEQVREQESVYIEAPVREGENIRQCGEEFRQGDEVLPAQSLITPAVIGLMAAFGYTLCEVYRKPSIALLATGDEIVPTGEPLRPGHIYDTNTPALKAGLKAIGIDDVHVWRTGDSEASIRQHISDALHNYDIIITAGGVSVGEYDFVKESCQQLGVKMQFWQVAIKPGKPVYFGTFRDAAQETKLVFGLPGNPVSALVTFEQLVKPALFKIMGRRDFLPMLFRATLLKELRKPEGRLEFVRGKLRVNDGSMEVMPLRGQESHMLGGLALSNCLIHFPAAEEMLLPDAVVNVQLASWA